MNIYSPIVPTYLYIKQHSITKKKYFGKTSLPDPIKYLGSGTYWNDHINKHGKQFVETIWLSELYIDTSISEYGLRFSAENNIVESDDWANLIPENGLDGGAVGMTCVVDGGTTKRILCAEYESSEYLHVNSGYINVKSISTTVKSRVTVEEYLSNTDLVHHTKGSVTVKDKENKTCRVSLDDPEYLNGNLKNISSGMLNVKNDKGEIQQVSVNDPRYLDGTLKSVREGITCCKDKDGNIFDNVSIDDPRYLSGELVHVNKGIKDSVVSCPHCGKIGGQRNLTRYHFSNCIQAIQ
jgi:hypothetical protein